jgi:hypothetical protein
VTKDALNAVAETRPGLILDLELLFPSGGD